MPPLETRLSRPMQITLAVLLAGVVAGALYLRGLQDRLDELGQTDRVEQQARRELLQPPLSTPTDTPEKARMFWFSPAGGLAAVEIELALSADPAERARQLLNALVRQAPSPAQRTLPADAALLEVYILPDGTVVADFSRHLAAGVPAGILSEKLAVDSIARTLEANVPGVRRLKILLDGQESETLAGHLDLTGFFPLRGAATAAAAPPPPAGELTPPPAPGKLNH